MGKKEELKKLDVVVKRIVKNYQPDKIILFGSYAWGKPTEDSDFDLMIVKGDKKSGKEGFFEEHKKVGDIIKGELAIDVLIHSSEEVEKRLQMGDFFYENIVNKGRYLYGSRKLDVGGWNGKI